MTHKVDDFELRLNGFNEKADKLDDLFNLRNEIKQ